MSFSASYKQLGGTTGYSSNQGVWTKIQMQQQLQLQQQQLQQQQQQRKPGIRKRKKWLQEVGRNNAIYRISELDEREDSKLFSVPASNVHLRVPNVPNIIPPPKQPASPEIDILSNPHLPQIIVTVEHEPQPLAVGVPFETKTEPESKATLKPPIVRPRSPVLIREDTSLQRIKKQLNIKKSDTSRYVESPKYTHINVPRRDVRVTHVSQESLDSPFVLPKIDHSKQHSHCSKRKPVTISLSQGLTLAKASVRKRWNFRSTNEPFNFIIAPRSAGSGTTKDTVESKGSKSNSHEFGSVPSTSLEDLRIRSLKGVLSDHESSDNISDLNDAVKSVLSKTVYRGSCDANKENTGHKINVSKSDTSRKKWVLPDFWPNQMRNGKTFC